MSPPPPTPITIVTGFLGSGKTTLLLNLLPQLPPTYRLCLLKNEFGDQAIDSQLAAAQAISGVAELVNGCICCNLTGQLGDALRALRADYSPHRIVLETSGSAFPATLVMELNRLIAEGRAAGEERYALDGVVSVLDVENWAGYEDTSVTAKLQARYTDLVVFNKWEGVSERRFDECLDRLGDLEVQTPWVKSQMGRVDKEVFLGLDGGLSARFEGEGGGEAHAHDHSHSSEVDVLGVTLTGRGTADVEKLRELLAAALREEVYRIKGYVWANQVPKGSDGQATVTDGEPGDGKYILNWAFGRWNFTPVPGVQGEEPAIRLTIITAQYESAKWRKAIEQKGYLVLADAAHGELSIEKLS